MDFFSQNTSRDVDFMELSNLSKALMLLIATFQITCFMYNLILLMATYQNRRILFLPLAYMTVMSTSGLLVTAFMTLNMWTYMFLNHNQYQEYLIFFGREATVGSTFSYLNSILITVLMTLNRLAVVIKPFNQWFTHSRVFIYSGIIALIVFISLLIPYFSPCSVTFMLNRLSFVSACAPGRHQITTFQNTYAIYLPLTCMVINLGIILHLRLLRNDTYSSIKNRFFKTSEVIVVVGLERPASSAHSKMMARRDFVMMRQTVSIAAFLSIYELGAFITKVLPSQYAGLPISVRDTYFYFRMESIAFMNFFIYYMETPSTRRMIRRFLDLSNENSSIHPTVATVAMRVN